MREYAFQQYDPDIGVCVYGIVHRPTYLGLTEAIDIIVEVRTCLYIQVIVLIEACSP